MENYLAWTIHIQTVMGRESVKAGAYDAHRP